MDLYSGIRAILATRQSQENDSKSDTVWVNHAGTFGVSSAPYWWAKLAALHNRWFMDIIYVDDLHGVFVQVIPTALVRVVVKLIVTISRIVTTSYN